MRVSLTVCASAHFRWLHADSDLGAPVVAVDVSQPPRGRLHLPGADATERRCLYQAPACVGAPVLPRWFLGTRDPSQHPAAARGPNARIGPGAATTIEHAGSIMPRMPLSGRSRGLGRSIARHPWGLAPYAARGLNTAAFGAGARCPASAAA